MNVAAKPLLFASLALAILTGRSSAASIDHRLAGVDRFDGRAGASPASLGAWRQLHDELRQVGDSDTRPAAAEVVAQGRARHDAIPIALVFDRYGDAAELRTAFAAAALQPQSWRGGD